MKLCTHRKFKAPKDLTENQRALVNSWKKEPHALALADESGFVIWHRIDYAPEGASCKSHLLIDLIFVKESQRKQGHGKAFLNALKGKCAAHQGLCVITDLDDTEQFFIKQDFKQHSEHPDSIKVLIYNSTTAKIEE